jgi:hypothetical protein
MLLLYPGFVSCCDTNESPYHRGGEPECASTGWMRTLQPNIKSTYYSHHIPANLQRKQM